MNRMRARSLSGVLLLAFAFGVATTGRAQEATGWSGTLFVTSDLRDRGVSLSGRDPSGGGALYHDRADGFYGGLSVRRIDDPRGNDVMASLHLGRSGIIGAYDWNLDLSGDLLLGEDAFFYPEITFDLSRDFGLAIFSAGTALAPDGRWLVPGKAAIDWHGGIEWPVPRAPWLAVTVAGGVEFQDKAGDNGYWRLGLVAGWRSFRLTLAYEDSSLSLRRARAGVVARLGWDF